MIFADTRCKYNGEFFLNKKSAYLIMTIYIFFINRRVVHDKSVWHPFKGKINVFLFSRLFCTDKQNN